MACLRYSPYPNPYSLMQGRHYALCIPISKLAATKTWQWILQMSWRKLRESMASTKCHCKASLKTVKMSLSGCHVSSCTQTAHATLSRRKRLHIPAGSSERRCDAGGTICLLRQWAIRRPWNVPADLQPWWAMPFVCCRIRTCYCVQLHRGIPANYVLPLHQWNVYVPFSCHARHRRHM